MTTLNNVVLFVVVLVVLGSVVPADGQTRAETAAYASMDRAVQAAQANPTADRIAAAQREIRSAYNVFMRQVQRVREADTAFHNAEDLDPVESPSDNMGLGTLRVAQRVPELLGRSTAPYRSRQVSHDALWAAHAADWNVFLRNVYAGVDEIRDAAEAIGRLNASGASNDLRRRFEDANMATIQKMGNLLRTIRVQSPTGISENPENSNWNPADADLSDLIDAVSAIAGAMASRQRTERAETERLTEEYARERDEQQQERAEQGRGGTTAEQQRADMEPEPENLAWIIHEGRA